MKFPISICKSLVIVIAMQTLSVGSLNAQEKDIDRINRIQENRAHERRLRSDVRKEEWRKKFNAEKYLKGQDRNKDGVLEPKEIRSDKFLQQMGIPTGKTAKIEDLVKGYNTRAANESKKERKAFEKRLRTLPQFGATKENVGVEKFGTVDKSEGLLNFDETSTGLKASDFEPEMLKKADKLLSSFDRDGSGFLDGDEISRASWKSPPPEESDLNRDGRLSKMELAKRFSLAQESNPSNKSNGYLASSEPDSSESRGKFKGPGKHGEFKKGKDRKHNFDRRYDNGATGKAVAKAKANANSPARFKKYVNEAFEKYDSDSDGKLNKDELASAKLLKKTEDTDGDGMISKQEALVFVSGGKKKSSTSPKVTLQATSNSDNYRRDSREGAAPSSQRSSLDKMDTNADGQIQMHEYSDTWTAEKLKEFRDKDKNGDGLLSPTEWRNRSR